MSGTGPMDGDKHEEAVPQGVIEQVEQLAMGWVLGDGSGEPWDATKPEWFAALRCIQEASQTAGRSDLADIAAETAELLSRLNQSEAADRPGVAQAIQNDIVRLQQVVGRTEAPAPEASGNPALWEDPELIGDFILESREHLESIEGHLLALEQQPDNVEPLHAIFRAFHTIKGLAGFLELPVIREVAHEVETVLDQARNLKLRVTSAVVDTVLLSADFLRREIARVESEAAGGEHRAEADCTELLRRIRELAEGSTEVVAPACAAVVNEDAEPPGARDADSAKGGNPNGAAPASALRVETAKLDYLVDMVGELVIAQALVRHSPELGEMRNTRLLANLGQLSRITTEVQKTAMSMRMIPIGQLFRKMARLVRDLSRKAGKQVELETEGEETELDRNVVEELADPLMHMVRNAIDHGIESSAERDSAGKDPNARIRLRASHQAGHIAIEISDDGRGISREKVLAKARQRGIVQDGSNLSETEILNLIMEPGFSTADQVTEISGRGVGMDVVQKQIQKLRGRTEIQSTPGRGTTFTLKVPLTLAIIEGLVVGVGAERYIVPIFAVKEMLRPTADMVSTIENRQEIALVRGRVLPIIRLHKRFNVEPRSSDATESLLILSEARGQAFCLMVDDLVGKQEVVIKGLGETFKSVRGIAGGAILGDGRVGLILDMDGIFERDAHV